MNKRKETITRAMAELLEIPKDLVLDLPKITIIGTNELYLENHKGIIGYSGECLRISLTRGYMEIDGENLEIKALMPDDMTITGEIRAVKFLD